MSRNNDQITIDAADGTPLGFRAREAAERLLAGGYVKPSYGRKGHLKTIYLLREDRTSPVEPDYPSGTHYSYRQQLESGQRCWKLKRLQEDAFNLDLVGFTDEEVEELAPRGGSVLRRDRSHRNAATRRPPGRRRALPCARGLVGGVEDL